MAVEADTRLVDVERVTIDTRRDTQAEEFSPLLPRGSRSRVAAQRHRVRKPGRLDLDRGLKVPGMRFGSAHGKTPPVEQLCLCPDALDERADLCRELLAWHLQRRVQREPELVVRGSRERAGEGLLERPHELREAGARPEMIREGFDSCVFESVLTIPEANPKVHGRSTTVLFRKPQVGMQMA